MYSSNIGKPEDTIGRQILLLLVLLAILHTSTGYIDCRISCRRCHENTEHPSVLEVYCAMCEECKQRRREKLQGKSAVSPGSILEPHPSSPVKPTPLNRSPAPAGHRARMMREGTEDTELQHVLAPNGFAVPPPPPVLFHAPPVLEYSGVAGYPPGCPTPPPCSESEEEVTLRYREPPTVTTTITTTTTTTTTPAPPTTHCPAFPPCIKKRKRPYIHPAPYMAPMMMMPCMPCMPACPYPCPGAAPPTLALLTQSLPTTTTGADFQYVYIGIPKSALRARNH